MIKNPKYKKNKKNGGNIPAVTDSRTIYVPIGCQKCMECKKQKANGWRIRLLEEIRHDNTGKFVTFTFNEDKLNKLRAKINRTSKTKLKDWDLDNAVATKAMRYFLENWRAEKKKSVKHWGVTELGHNGTERIHIHAIIFTNDTEGIKKHWHNGFVHIGSYVNENSVNYITKYVNKADESHKEYNSIILTSAGIGKGYFQRIDRQFNKYNKEETKEVYRTRQGSKIGLPIYYRNEIYSDEEREKLWIHRLNKNERYVLGQRIDIRENEDEYKSALREAQKLNEELGYGGKEDWEKDIYEKQRKGLK
jgi:hypothetical protein